MGAVDISTCFVFAKLMFQGVSVGSGIQHSGTVTGIFYNFCKRCDCRMAIMSLLASLNFDHTAYPGQVAPKCSCGVTLVLSFHILCAFILWSSSPPVNQVHDRDLVSCSPPYPPSTPTPTPALWSRACYGPLSLGGRETSCAPPNSELDWLVYAAVTFCCESEPHLHYNVQTALQPGRIRHQRCK